LSRKEFENGKGQSNRRALKLIVEKEQPPGVLAYLGHEPVGWCAIAPREVYIRLQNSRVLAPVDEQSVWSISCLFVARPFRGQGVSVKLIEAAAELARKNGAKIVEGYPVEPYSEKMPAAFAWTGLVSAFKQAGFREVARRSDSRPIMRREWKKKGPRKTRKTRK
jgi:GNAT superfamily N-acetyltransferase